MKNNDDKIKYRYLVMDVDGTLTDGKIYMGDNGEVFKAFNIKDGCGIHDLAISNGITPVIITGRFSRIVMNRCRELEIYEIHQGIKDKASKLKEIVQDLSTVAYIGDDIIDLPCMKLVREAGGIVGCPRDAVKQVREIADFVAEHDGGDGAVRDFVEQILKEYSCSIDI